MTTSGFLKNLAVNALTTDQVLDYIFVVFSGMGTDVLTIILLLTFLAVNALPTDQVLDYILTVFSGVGTDALTFILVLGLFTKLQWDPEANALSDCLVPGPVLYFVQVVVLLGGIVWMMLTILVVTALPLHNLALPFLGVTFMLFTVMALILVTAGVYALYLMGLDPRCP